MRNPQFILLFVLAMGACSASASVTVKPGHFFGHDLTQNQSVVYVLDLSGSMADSSGSVVEQAGTRAAGEAVGGIGGMLFGRQAGNALEDRVKRLRKKIEKVKLHLIASLQGLPNGSTFNVVLFSDGVQKLAPGLLVSNPTTNGLVSLFVDRLEEGGGTNMYAALEAGIFSGAEHVILLTDGMPTSSSPEDILALAQSQAGPRGVRISTVGVGGDQAYSFLHQLAEENGGTAMSYD